MVDAAGHTTTYGYDARRTSDRHGRCPRRRPSSGRTTTLGHRIRQENRSRSPMTASDHLDVRRRRPTADPHRRQRDHDATVYDVNGNKLTATTGSLTSSPPPTTDSTGVLTVDDEDAGTTADTTYTYSLTSPRVDGPDWHLRRHARSLRSSHGAVNDPVNASNFVTTYRADGQTASVVAPNGNTTASTYDTAGHLLTKNTTAAGPTNRALYTWTYNRAGQVLNEASTITGDTSNGTITYGYDPLGRLTGSTDSVATTAYAWDAVPNRTSVKVGAGTPDHYRLRHRQPTDERDQPDGDVHERR